MTICHLTAFDRSIKQKMYSKPGTYRGIHPILLSQIFSLSFILLDHEKIFSKSYNSLLKLTKKVISEDNSQKFLRNLVLIFKEFIALSNIFRSSGWKLMILLGENLEFRMDPRDSKDKK